MQELRPWPVGRPQNGAWELVVDGRSILPPGAGWSPLDSYDDPKWIARRLRPSITARQAEQALSVLTQLGFLVRDAAGKLVQHEPALSTGDDQPLGHHIVTFHRTMLARAGEALDGVARDEREIASLTLSLDAAQFRDFKRRLYDLRQELLQLATANPNAPDRVVQINFQMFPLSRADAAGDESARVSPEENGTRV